MHSVVDVAGINAISRRVLGNAADAMAGMVQYPVPIVDEKPTLGMTMFGVTTPCVTAVRESLEARGFDCLVFHATGTGGQAMEKLVEAGLIQGVLDITTTEVADEVVGGILPCGPHRFEAILEAKVPFVLSVGALDMVNFGALETVPERFRDRLASCSQRAGDPDADDARRESPLCPLDRRKAQSIAQARSAS